MINLAETDIRLYGETNLPTLYGELKVSVFSDPLDGKEHLALIKEEIGDGEDIPVRLHSQCLTGEVFGSLK